MDRKEYRKKYYQHNKDKEIKQARIYYYKNKRKRLQQMKEYMKGYYLQNREKSLEYQKKYRQKNKKIIKEYQTEYAKKYSFKRRLEDENFKLLGNLRSRITMAIKNYKKGEKTKKLLGCSIEQLKHYLEKKFKKGMTWDNYGKYWEIDHIKPCCSFDLSKLSEQCKCFHYNNLQPLTVKENRSKRGIY